MARPPNKIIARHSLTAMLVVIILVLIGTVARALYVGIVHPGENWVAPADPHPFTLALGLGLAAGVAEAFFSFAGIRARHCRDYADADESAALI